MSNKEMSFQQQLFTSVNNVVEQYITRVSKIHNIPMGELMGLWNGGASTPPTSTTSGVKNAVADILSADNLNPLTLTKMNKKELENLCRSKGLKVTGKKADLINRLCGKDEDVVSEPKVAKPTKDENPHLEKDSRRQLAMSLGFTGEAESNVISLTKNAHGNLEHVESKMVYNQDTQKFYGKQLDNGTVTDLTSDDIEYCKQHGYDYEIPLNLNQADDEIQLNEEDDLADETAEIITIDEEVTIDADDVDDEEEEDEGSDIDIDF